MYKISNLNSNLFQKKIRFYQNSNATIFFIYFTNKAVFFEH